MPILGAGYIGDYAEDYTTLNLKFSTFTTGWVPVALAGTPIISIYTGSATGTEVTTGVTHVEDFDGITGLNNVLIDLSSAAFYAVAADYHIVITQGTIDSVEATGTVVGSFSIENRKSKADVIEWLGTAVTAGVAGKADVNIQAINNNSTAAQLLKISFEEGALSVADSGTTTTLVDASRTEADDHWNGALLIFRTGTNAGYTAVVTDFDAASDTLTFAPAVPSNVTTESYGLIPGLGHTAAITDAVWAQAMTELGSVPGVTGTTLAALEWLFLLARNKGTQTSTTKTLRNAADDADIGTSAISATSDVFTRGEWS